MQRAHYIASCAVLIAALAIFASREKPMQSSSKSTDVKIASDEAYRYIDANGIPDHETGHFPNRGNPNAISPQRYHLRVLLNPQASEKSIPNRFPNLVGIAINGVPFDPATNEWYRKEQSTGWNIEAINTMVTPAKRNLGIDIANAHVQPTGAYHYHSVPWPLVKAMGGADYAKKMTLIGYAADGYPMYGPYAYSDAKDAESAVKLMHSSYRLKQGNRPSGPSDPGGKYDGTYTRDWEYVKGSGDLDENNGRSGVTLEYPNGTYYYVVTDEFPFIGRSFHGAPDASFERGPRQRHR